LQVRESITRRALPALAALLILALPSPGSAERAGALADRQRSLAAKERSLALELYALSSRIEQARAQLARIGERLAALRREQAAASAQLRAAQTTLAAARSRLADQVRALYLEDAPDPLEVILGAVTLEEALDGIDSLGRTAEATATVLAEAEAARGQVTRLLRSLGARQAELERLHREAGRALAALAAAEAGRAAYLERVRAERRATERQLAVAQTQAEAARAAAAVETLRARAAPSLSTLSPPVGGPSGEGAPAAAISPEGRTLTVLATAYSLPGSTAIGLPVGPGVVAVDPAVIPLGTRLTIPGYGEGVAADTGPAIRGLRIDVWVRTPREALLWGWRRVTIILHA
jgi:cystine transport system substrate-binding protein